MFRDENRQARINKGIMTARTVVVYIVLILLAFMCVFTLFTLTITCTHDSHFLRTNGFSILPGKEFFANCGRLFMKVSSDKYAELQFSSDPNAVKEVFEHATNYTFMKAFGYSALIAVLSTALSVYFSTVVAYGIHMYQFKLRNAAFTFILVIMMIPTQVSATGFLSLCHDLHIRNTIWPLVIPAIAAPNCFFYIKQYMESVLPFEMVEAARVDGAGEIRTFHQIVLPVMKPALAVQIIFSFVGSWNNYFTPSLILYKGDKKTLPMVISQLYVGSDGYTPLAMINITIFFAIIPLVIVYFIFSKYIIKGLTLGAVKG